MVNIVLENLLSTACNRVLYQTLWSFSMAKSCKPENLKNCENFSIEFICNEIMQEMAQDEPNPSKFFFSAQLVFGVIQLYKFQIDKLLNQAKNTLQSCSATFFDISWLAQIQKPVESDSLLNVTIKKTKKRENRALTSEIELIEQALTIPDDIESVRKRRDNKKAAEQLDSTIIDNKNITILEKFPPKGFNDICSVINEDFGDEPEEDFSVVFAIPSRVKRILRPIEQELQDLPIQEAPKTIEDLPELELHQYSEAPDILRTVKDRQSPNLELIEPTIAEDVMDIVKQQRMSLKRMSDTLDVSERLERAAKVPRLSSNDVNLPEFDGNANFSGSPEKENLPPDELVVVAPPPSPEARKKREKPRQRKRKLIMDKVIKISDEEIRVSVREFDETYQKVLVTATPREVFMQNFWLSKFSLSDLFEKPGSRLRICAAEPLKPLFNRNLKVLKHKPARTESVEENLPAKKRKLQKRAEVQEAVNHLRPQDVQDLVELPALMELPPIEAIKDPVDLPAIEALEVPELDPVEPAVRAKCGRKASKNYSAIDSCDYRENQKWTKEQTIEAIDRLWQQKQRISMAELCANTNRFIAVGVFLQLMVLSKEGAVELVQGEALQIVDIVPGPQIGIYI